MGPAWQIGAATALTALGSVARGQAPAPRVFVGGAVVAIGLAALAAKRPDIAGGFATVVLLTAALTSGYDVATGVYRSLNTPGKVNP